MRTFKGFIVLVAVIFGSIAQLFAVTFIIYSTLRSIPAFRDYDYYGNLEYVVRFLAVDSDFIIKIYAVTATILLFAFRGYRPKSYGVLEVLVGVAAIFNAPAIAELNVPAALPLLTGAYIVVRGLDNIGKNLDPESPMGERFTYLFNNPPRKKEPTRFGVENAL
ncbi:hypothetical protein AB9F43_26225 [Rhizobium leguminosarum]|uniref:hypothetical protein n=1 Tax=Rhizobium leguminosarum TaxID=384 RepID=UPI003F98C3FC